MFFLFDLLVLADVNVMSEPLTARRALLEKKILPKLTEPIRYSLEFDTPLPDLIAAAKAQGLRAWLRNAGTAGTSRACGRVLGRRCV